VADCSRLRHHWGDFHGGAELVRESFSSNN
jgi:hypothetical protein